MGVQAELVLLLMFASTVKTDEDQGGVEFWRNTVKLTCPGNGDWYHSEKKIHNGTTFEHIYEKEFKYHCRYPETDQPGSPPDSFKKYHFYVKGKTCENCFELDATLFGIAIIVDLIGTVGLMMLIFRCTKRSSDGPAHSPKPPVSSGSRPPPTVPDRDYQELNPRTRATETYSTVVNRMG